MPTSISTRTSGSLNPTRQQLDELDALLKRMLELPVNHLEEAEQAAIATQPEEAAEEPPPPPPPPMQIAPLAPPPEPQPAASLDQPPPSYMVVETASPRPLPPASGFEPRPSALTPRLLPVTGPEQDASPEPATPDPAVAEESSEPEVWVPLRSTWQPSAQTWQPLADSWHQANGTQPPLPAPQQEMPREILLPQPTVEPMPQPTPPKAIESPDAPPTAPTPAEPRLSLTAEDAPAVLPRPLLPLLWFNQGFDACLVPLGAVGRWLCGHRGRQTLGLIGLACLAIAVAIAVSSGMPWSR